MSCFLFNHFLNISSQLKMTGFVASHAFNVMVMTCLFQTVTVKHEWNFKKSTEYIFHKYHVLSGQKPLQQLIS